MVLLKNPVDSDFTSTLISVFPPGRFDCQYPKRPDTGNHRVLTEMPVLLHLSSSADKKSENQLFRETVPRLQKLVVSMRTVANGKRCNPSNRHKAGFCNFDLPDWCRLYPCPRTGRVSRPETESACLSIRQQSPGCSAFACFPYTSKETEPELWSTGNMPQSAF